MTEHERSERAAPRPGQGLQVGWATSDLTPDAPTPMRNDMMSKGSLDPITATAVALESHAAGVVLVSCDLLWIPDGRRSDPDLVGGVRERVATLLAGSGPEHVVLSATHTHASLPGRISDSVTEELAGRIAATVVAAWESRRDGGVSFGLGHAVAGHNRVVQHRDGTARMVGSFQRGTVTDPDFVNIQGFEDHSVHLLYTWNAVGDLTGVVANVACPAQVQRGDRLSADYWHEVREELALRLGSHIHLLPQLSAAGDTGTHVMVEKPAEERMARLMFPDIDDPVARRRRQIAIRISDAVTSTLPWMRNVIDPNPIVNATSRTIDLPGGFPQPDPDSSPYTVEINAIRVGDVAIITNPFELYLDYGTRIKGQSPAVQTFVVQLAGSGSYLPTERAIPGGSYGAISRTCRVGPAAGDALVDASIELLTELWS